MKKKKVFKKSLVFGLSLLSALSCFSNFATVVRAEGDEVVPSVEPSATPTNDDGGETPVESESPVSSQAPETSAIPENTPDSTPDSGNDGEKQEETVKSISSVALTMSEPTLNETLSTDVSETSGYVSIGNVSYYVGETLVEDSVAKELTVYTVQIELDLSDKAIEENIIYDQSIGATINEKVASITPSSDGKTATVKYTFNKTAEDPDSAIDLNLTVVAPQVLELPDYNIGNASSDVVVSSTTWYDDDAVLDSRSAYQLDHDYKVVIALTSTNKKFDSESKVTLNNKEVELEIVDEHNATVTYDFGKANLIEIQITPKEITDTVIDTGLGLQLHDYFDWPQYYGEETYTLDKEATTADVSFMSVGKMFVVKGGSVTFSVHVDEQDEYTSADATITFNVDKSDTSNFTRASEAGTSSNALEVYKQADYTNDDVIYVYNGNGDKVLVKKIKTDNRVTVESGDGTIRIWQPRVGTFFGEEIGAEIKYICEVKSGHKEDKFAINFMETNSDVYKPGMVEAHGGMDVMTLNGRSVRIEITFYKDIDKSLDDVNGTVVNMETQAMHLFYGGDGLSNETAFNNNFEWTAGENDDAIAYLNDGMPSEYAASTTYLNKKVFYSTDTRLNDKGTNPITNAEYLYDGKGKATLTYYVGHTGADYTTYTFNKDGTVKSVDGDTSIWFKTAFKHISNVNTGLYYLEIDPNGGVYEDKTGENKAYQRTSGTSAGNPDNWFIEDLAYETDGISVPTREGYSFDGWEVVKGPGYLNDAQDKYTFGEGNGKIVAKWRHYTIFTEVVNGSITGDNDGNMVTESGSVTEILPGEDRTIKYEPKDEYHYLSYIEVSSRNTDGTWNDPEKVSIEDFKSQYDFIDINCDYKIKVVYEPATLTIHYVEKDTDYVMWQDVHVPTKGTGDAYKVTSPDIQGYTVYADGESQKVVQGVMPSNTHEITVYYEKNAMIGSDITLYVTSDPDSGKQVAKGEEITYTVTAQNTGVQGPQDTTFTLTIPQGTTFKEIVSTSADTTVVSYDEETNTISGTFSQVARGIGQTVVYKVIVNENETYMDEEFASPIYQMATWSTDKDSTKRESNLTVHYMDEDVQGPASLYVQKTSTTLIKRTVTTTTKYDISGYLGKASGNNIPGTKTYYSKAYSNGGGTSYSITMGTFVAPEDGDYTFEVVGGSTWAGSYGYQNAYGAKVRGTISLNAGDTLYGITGASPWQNTNAVYYVSGGGGSCYYYDKEDKSYYGEGGVAGAGASLLAVTKRGELQAYSNATSELVAVAGGAGQGHGGQGLTGTNNGNFCTGDGHSGGGWRGGKSTYGGTSYVAGSANVASGTVAITNTEVLPGAYEGNKTDINGHNSSGGHVYIYYSTSQTYYEAGESIDNPDSGSSSSSVSKTRIGGALSVEQSNGALVKDPTNYVTPSEYIAPVDGTYHLVISGGYTALSDTVRYGAKVELDVQLQKGDTLYGLNGYHTWLNKNTDLSRTVNGGGASGGNLAGSGASFVAVKKVGNGEIINYTSAADKATIIAVAGGAGRSGVGQGVLASGTFAQGTTGSGGGYYGGTNGSGGSSYVASSVITNGHAIKISNASIITGGEMTLSTGAHKSGNGVNYEGAYIDISYVSDDYDNDFITSADKSNGIINYTRTNSTSGSTTTDDNIDTTITYAITFKNDGAVNAKNVVLHDSIPYGTDYVEDSIKVLSENSSVKNFKAEYDKDSNMLYIYGSDLKQGDVITITFDVSVNGESALIQNQVDFDRDVDLDNYKSATLKHKSDIVEHKLKGKIVVTKEWLEEDDLTDRPASITAHLKGSDGTDLTATLSDANNWTYTFDIEYNKEATYTIYEDEVELYESNATSTNPIAVGEYNAVTIRNTYMPNFNVSKDVKNEDGVSIDGEYVKVNDELTYEITIENPTTTTKYYDVEDEVPANTTYASGGTYDETNNKVTFSAVKVEPNSSATVSFKVKVNDDAYRATIVNKATVWLLRSSGTRIDSRKQETNEVTNYTIDDTQFVKDVVNLDDESIDKTYVKAGDTFYYTIKVENFAKDTKEFTITDTLPKEVSFVEADNNGTCANGIVTWKINVESNKTETVKVKVRVNDDVKTAIISNFANIAVDHTDEDTNEVENKAAIIVIDKEVNIKCEEDMYFVFDLKGSNGIDLASMVEVKAKQLDGEAIVSLPSYTGYNVTYTITEKDGNGTYTCESVEDITSSIGDTYSIETEKQATVEVKDTVVTVTFDENDLIAGIYVRNIVNEHPIGKLNMVGHK